MRPKRVMVGCFIKGGSPRQWRGERRAVEHLNMLADAVTGPFDYLPIDYLCN